MRLLHRVFALMLAALWLPAVAHCGMEAIGEQTEERGCCTHESDTPEASQGACVADHCGVFDEGHYRADGESEASLLPPVAVLADLCELWLDVRSGSRGDEPSAWPGPPVACSRLWMFEQRAAPLANAPGLLAG